MKTASPSTKVHLPIVSADMGNNLRFEQVDGIQRLPLELLGNVLQQLPRSSLKHARLTCKDWRDEGARHLFHRLFFAPRKEVISVFTNVAQIPALAAGVRELVYDARLFWRYLDSSEAYNDAFDDAFPRAYPENDISDEEESGDEDADDPRDDILPSIYHDTALLSDLQIDHHTPKDIITYEMKARASALKYSNLLREQEKLLSGQEDLTALRAGLGRLPKLQRITVLDRFGNPLDYEQFAWNVDEFRFYHHWSQRLCAGISLPTRWSEADLLNNGAQLEAFPWDFRGIKHLLLAASEHAGHLRELSLGCQMSNLSAAIYTNNEIAMMLHRIAPRLTNLKLDTRSQSSAPSQHPLDCTEIMMSLLSQARQLTSLAITLPDEGSGGDWTRVFMTLSWPHLKILDLGDGSLGSEAFRAIAKAHSITLRELRLRNVALKVGSLWERTSWEDLAAELGRSLRLDFVYMVSMTDHVGLTAGRSPYLKSVRTSKAARLFMQGIPDKLMCVKETGEGKTLIWHKERFRPSFDLDRVCEDCRART